MLSKITGRLALATFTFVLLCTAGVTSAQTGKGSVYFQVSNGPQRLEMIVSSSRILTLDFDVPKLLVNNTQIVKASPLSPNQIQVSAMQPGVTQLNVWDASGNVRTIDVVVFGDARELTDILKTEFPDSTLRVRPSNGGSRSSVIISGYVPRPEEVSRIITIAQDFYPNVIPNIQVGGMQQVALHCKVVEVSRTKLQQFGIDWAALTGNDYIISSAAGLITAAATQGGSLVSNAASLNLGVLNGTNSIGFFIDVLRQHNLAKLLAEPTLITVSGRPASFNSGGEVPVPVSSGLGATSVEYREFGTQIDFVPIVMGNGKIRLEVRPQITEVDDALRDQVTGSPGFRSRRVDTGVELEAGQTLALAGLIQNRTSSIETGLPWLSDLPFVGAAFGRVEQRTNEIELLILVTPEFVAPMDAHETPACGPGQLTRAPNDVEFYFRRYREVPKCGPGGCEPAGEMQGGQVVQGEVIQGGVESQLPPGAEMLPPTSQPEIYEGVPAGNLPTPAGSQMMQPSGDLPLGAPMGSARQPAGRQWQQVSVNQGGAAQPSQTIEANFEEPQLIGPIGYDVIK